MRIIKSKKILKMKSLEESIIRKYSSRRILKEGDDAEKLFRY